MSTQQVVKIPSALATCPSCRKAKTVKHGRPQVMASGFVDQVIYCRRCDWCRVVSELVEEDAGPVQLAMF